MDAEWAMVALLLLLPLPMEYPETDLGNLDATDGPGVCTGWSKALAGAPGGWRDELFFTRRILALQMRHLRGRSLLATASWMLWTKHSLHWHWWPHGDTSITARAWQQTTHCNLKSKKCF